MEKRMIGLTEQEVAERIEKGLDNRPERSDQQSVGKILCKNLFTFFNILNFVLAGLVFLTGSYRNMLFLGVVFSNLIIGTVQELRAKRTIEKLTLLSNAPAKVIRDGREASVAVEKLVQDDVVHLRQGNQICADAVILSGKIEVNEALLTGEADAIEKKEGDSLLSGSFVTAGECYARVERVGSQSYAAKITRAAKKKKQSHSELMDSLNRLLRVVTALLIPLGLCLFTKQYFFLHSDWKSSIVTTVAAVIGMIPEGLVLLTSMALAVGVVRLGKYRTLVQELYGIETLARVDVLCVDKTGTITQGDMRFREIIPWKTEDEAQLAQAKEVMTALVHTLSDDSPTFTALRKAFFDKDFSAEEWESTEIMPFSSDRKWSGVSFAERGSYLLGASEYIFSNEYEEVRRRAGQYGASGARVLILAHCEEALSAARKQLSPLAFFLIDDVIRSTAPETFRFFREQGVQIKVISGDHPATAAQIAARAGIDGAERYVELSSLSDEEVEKCAEQYTVFGRVTPQQKKILVKALQKKGHTVAMTGDGINDVLALREADCSIAMASGSDGARHVAKLVLLDSDFSALPRVVAEGRRVINNIQRSASLFLVKTGYSVFLTFLLIFFAMAYPFQPIQLTLISTLTIGIPSFFLALEPNHKRVKGNFLINVMHNALPGVLTVATGLMILMAFGYRMNLLVTEINTACTLLAGFIGLLVLGKVCLPWDGKRAALWLTVGILFYGGAIFCGKLFLLSPWNMRWGGLLLCMMAAVLPLYLGYLFAVERLHPLSFLRYLRKKKSVIEENEG